MAVAISMPADRPGHATEADHEPTARRGNMSEAIVNRLADQPWWAAAARPTRATAAHGS